ncbi:hypothetical protein PGTUg99_028226 [Puccinia graminis f. sp. tritici]|uniref:Uncharacterized protein n=1 Tax=Puccinia graminis f. sp. tritici TaxID=56615 RepID=A0A5B0QUC3_PUCGR|nr:hypothetical protein PGTUg99_028226 [Puccinia graminis f. sp. tritici]
MYNNKNWEKSYSSPRHVQQQQFSLCKQVLPGSRSAELQRYNDVSSLFKPAHSHLITLIDTTTLDSK